MSEFLETIRNMEEDEIDPADLTPLISSMNVPIVTVLEDKNDRVEDADEDKDEDEDEDENEDKDKDESEDEDENSNLPGLQTDKSSIDDLLGDSDSDSEVGWRLQVNGGRRMRRMILVLILQVISGLKSISSPMQSLKRS